tara:strand:+ start:4384 stop:4608 length:225 start_codon:yes stop_codon:yes gene_type:complete
MKVGDLVYSLDYKNNGMTTQIKMALVVKIVEIKGYKQYVLQLIENGWQFQTSRDNIGEMNEYWNNHFKSDKNCP